ncbi:hypothetical protein B0H16DRAFT_1465492 [Mycena metata]|uniref:Uncharacterized protein n=1 Tax=Mycena metata TaxID=1033252 RepID=A0AAD7ICF7_9AGAR|nr:hypothetical protein B0H16DRAFT_1465492 [Mycena metata]
MKGKDTSACAVRGVRGPRIAKNAARAQLPAQSRFQIGKGGKSNESPENKRRNGARNPRELSVKLSGRGRWGRRYIVDPFCLDFERELAFVGVEGKGRDERGGGGGGFIILAWSKCLNNEFTEDKQVVMYGWLSLHKLQDANGAHTIPGGPSYFDLTIHTDKQYGEFEEWAENRAGRARGRPFFANQHVDITRRVSARSALMGLVFNVGLNMAHVALGVAPIASYFLAQLVEELT